jgi:hypothetical protein
LRHIRGDKELPALVDDTNYDVHYQEYRQFQKPVNVLPVKMNKIATCIPFLISHGSHVDLCLYARASSFFSTLFYFLFFSLSLLWESVSSDDKWHGSFMWRSRAAS